MRHALHLVSISITHYSPQHAWSPSRVYLPIVIVLSLQFHRIHGVCAATTRHHSHLEMLWEYMGCICSILTCIPRQHLYARSCLFEPQAPNTALRVLCEFFPLKQFLRIHVVLPPPRHTLDVGSSWRCQPRGLLVSVLSFRFLLT